MLAKGSAADPLARGRKRAITPKRLRVAHARRTFEPIGAASRSFLLGLLAQNFAEAIHGLRIAGFGFGLEPAHGV